MSDHFHENQTAEDRFLYQFGRTITQWQLVESACYRMYVALMRGADKTLISVNWHNIQSFDARITLLERCVFFALDESIRNSEWKQLLKRLRKSSEIRNAIVHSTYGVEVRGGIGTPRLAPSFMDATAIVRKRAMNPDYRYDENRLATESRKFHDLSIDLRRFCESHLAHG